MFLGHFGLALAVKGADPKLPLATLLAISAGPDLIDPLLSMSGVDGSALTHTGPACLSYFVVVITLTVWRTRRWSAALLCGILAASHFLADLITSRLELWPGGLEIGWRLYDLPWANFGLEAAIILGGWLMYRRTLPIGHSNHPVSLPIPVVLIGLQATVAAMGVN